MSISKATLLSTLKSMRQTNDTRYAVTVEAQAVAESGYAQTYVVKQNGVQVGAKINIPKDFLVKSAGISTVAAADKAADGKFENDESFAVGDKYLDFVVNTVGNDETDQHIYLNVKDLVDVYTGGNGIDIANDNTVSLVIDNTSVGGLTVGANGLKLATVTADTYSEGTKTADGVAGAMSSADKYKLDNIEAEANKYIHPELQGGALTGAETADATPAFGGTVSVSQVATDAAGHVTSLTSRTITIPNATAVAATSGEGGSAGLMSAADKEILDNLQSSNNETVTAEDIAGIFVD